MECNWKRFCDETPEKNKLVLCVGEKGGYFIGHAVINETCRDKVYMPVPNARSGCYATHWQPLPEQPKGD